MMEERGEKASHPPRCRLLVACWGCIMEKGGFRAGERMVGWSRGREGEGQEKLSLVFGWAGRGEDTGEDMLASPLFSQPAFAVSLISSVPLFAAGI